MRSRGTGCIDTPKTHLWGAGQLALAPMGVPPPLLGAAKLGTPLLALFWPVLLQCSEGTQDGMPLGESLGLPPFMPFLALTHQLVCLPLFPLSPDLPEGQDPRPNQHHSDHLTSYSI